MMEVLSVPKRYGIRRTYYANLMGYVRFVSSPQKNANLANIEYKARACTRVVLQLWEPLTKIMIKDDL